MKRIDIALLSVLALMPVAASADLTWYLGAGVGGMRLEEDINLTAQAIDETQDPPVLISSATKDKFEGNDVAYRFFGGVRLGPYLAVEAGYVNLGEPDDGLNLNIPPEPLPPAAPQRPETDVTIRLFSEIDGLDVHALGMLPLNDRWEAFAKLGLIKWDATVKIRNSSSDLIPGGPPVNFPAFPTVTPASSSTDEDGVDLAGGLGLTYKATERMSLRGEGTWYDIDDTDQLWMLGVNVIVSF
jgi:opacity protein-like surface antigen